MPTPLRTIRLRRHADYGVVYGASRKLQSTSLSFFYLLHPDAETPRASRFGITVPRALGPAVLRNRIKRRLRVVARAAHALLPSGIDVILHPRPIVATMPFPELEHEMNAIFRTITARLAAGAANGPLPRRPRTSGKGSGLRRGGGK